MNTRIDIQIIKQNGHPAFVVIPYDEYLKLFPEKPWIPDQDLIPHEVVSLTVKKGFTLIRAWREYLGLTQKEVAQKINITQAAYSQMESGGKKPRKSTLDKLAAAMGLSVEQLKE